MISDFDFFLNQSKKSTEFSIHWLNHIFLMLKSHIDGCITIISPSPILSVWVEAPAVRSPLFEGLGHPAALPLRPQSGRRGRLGRSREVATDVHPLSHIQWEYRPYIGLTYGRYLGFRFLKLPLSYGIFMYFVGYQHCRSGFTWFDAWLIQFQNWKCWGTRFQLLAVLSLKLGGFASEFKLSTSWAVD